METFMKTGCIQKPVSTKPKLIRIKERMIRKWNLKLMSNLELSMEHPCLLHRCRKRISPTDQIWSI